MATQSDPVAALAAVINHLYDLSGNLNISDPQQQQLVTQAHDLRDDLVALVEVQLDATDSTYKDMMTSLNNVTNAINQAEQKIQALINKVASAADVAAAVDALVSQTIQLGTTAAKLAA